MESETIFTALTPILEETWGQGLDKGPGKNKDRHGGLRGEANEDGRSPRR